MIYIATDHAGFEVKKDIVNFFKKENRPVEDLGPASFDPLDDYPDYGAKLAKKVAKSPANRGILICRSGIGMSIVANKVRGARAALCLNPIQAQKSREHNDANILVLAADFTPLDVMKKIIKKFLGTDFSGEERHRRRIKKISDLEKKGESK